MTTTKMTKNQMRRAKKKEQKRGKPENVSSRSCSKVKEVAGAESRQDTTSEAYVTDVSAPAVDISTIEPVVNDPTFAIYKDVFEKFGILTTRDDVEREANAGNKGEVFFDQDEDIPSEDESGNPKLSKKKRKQLNKLSIAELKSLVRTPEVVEWHDVSSSDPRLLVHIKATRNVVPVPAHWSLKREYLSSKRGVEKPPFKLPQFIADTGVTEMRDALLEKQEQQTLKQKQRERVNPKMNSSMDYNKLQDAFFRFQTKPDLTRYGDVYYEGKEWEPNFRHFRAGELSDLLKDALSIPPGAPPPWLINQQRFGPPPSYPNLKIPGLNAPPPPGGQWGFHPGGYGKPPVDEFNRPLFGGDIFGIAPAVEKDAAARPQGEPVVHELWGELQQRVDESDKNSQDDDDENDSAEDDELEANGTVTALEDLRIQAATGGVASTVPVDFGIESSLAGNLNLRKSRPSGIDTETPNNQPRQAYTILAERAVRAEGFFGSDRLYDLKAAQAAMTAAGGGRVLGFEEDSRKRKKPGDVDVALNPDQLVAQDSMSKDDLYRRYEEGRRAQGVGGGQWNRPYDDDLSQMIAEESRKKQKRDDDKRPSDSSRRKDATKYKF